MEKQLKNAVIGADPFIMFDPVSNSYYCYTTGDNKHQHFLIYHTVDLIHFDFVGYAYDDLSENNWGRDWFWAPECYYNPHNKLYYIFYSAKVNYDLVEKYFLEKDFDECCKIGVMVSSSPKGPFKNITSEPLDFSPFDTRVPRLKEISDKPFLIRGKVEDVNHGVYVPTIDADLFFEDDGKIFLFFSRCCYLNYVYDEAFDKYIEESNISCIELENDFWFDKEGKTMPKIKKEYIRYIDGARKDTFKNIINYQMSSQEWENAHVNDYENSGGKKLNRRWSEGSMVLKENDKYYIFYSCNNYENPYYGVGVAISDHIDGPYEKYDLNPVISQIPDFPLYSTGHGSITTKDGNYYYIFHGRSAVDVSRSVYSALIEIDNNKINVKNIHKGELI